MPRDVLKRGKEVEVVGRVDLTRILGAARSACSKCVQVHVVFPGIILVTQQKSRSIDNPIALEKKRSITVALQDNASILLLLLVGQESGTCGMFENLTNTLIGLC